MHSEYIYLNGQPLAKLDGGNTYYYHSDHLGTPQKMADSSGVVRWAVDYKPFGEASIDQTVTTITNNLRFPGQYYDVETGLHQNGSRDYSLIGRYIEADPVGIQSGKNHLYVYVENNPILFTDPFGYLGPNSNTYAGSLARTCCQGGVPSGVHDAPGVNDPAPGGH